jgi:hypothetical protein
MLFKDSRYPDNPDNTQTLPSFSTPENRGDDYGAKVTAYYQVKGGGGLGYLLWLVIARSTSRVVVYGFSATLRVLSLVTQILFLPL